MENLRKNTSRPADYDGAEANVQPKKQEAAPEPVFAGFKLKTVARPADYDGKEANVGIKKADAETPTVSYDVKLRKAPQQEAQ